MSSAAFYRSLGGGRYASSGATAGPWSPKTQHAGPPSALVGRLMERHEARPGMRIARVTVDLPRPVPVGDLDVEVTTVRAGERTELLEGRITSQGREVLLARAWRLVAAPGDTPALSPLAPVPPLPGPQPPQTMAGAYLDGYVSAMEWRFPPAAPGAAEPGFDTPGPGTAWARQRVPLVEGEADTPLTRALTLADSSWAVGFELDHRRGLVINTDVTLLLHRDPVGEWMCLRSATAAAAGGSGLAQGELHDGTGECGRILQTLLVT
ncbi:thioesterase family protein [Actinacidiphila bryophytorum]|uniref:thioesterase family protein n=1 Tax=Actinacidiphila bryophytorum TaxID=1436133 RepID=UPI002176C8C4|nr:thioesterase family protein [Actinacidiphila bryophytorum]UWE09917.1 thioesterase family protein [Actinacidiphila bryophytorum]